MTLFGTKVVTCRNGYQKVFQYALWRDVVWDVAIYVTFVAGLAFLYALWRDFVWDVPFLA